MFLLHFALLNRRVVLIRDAKNCVERFRTKNKNSFEDIHMFIKELSKTSVGCLHKFSDLHARCFEEFLLNSSKGVGYVIHSIPATPGN